MNLLRMLPGGERLERYAEATWTPPFTQALPSNAEAYAASVSHLKVARRRALREINLVVHGQRPLLRGRIDLHKHRRILWIHQGMPQVGDSLMDLAARVLLKGQVERLDLLTDAHLLGLYRNDEVFTQVASSPAELPGPYDLVLLHSISSRSLKDKLSSYRDTPYVHLQGCYTGPDFNRTLFGFYRLAQLLSLSWSVDKLNRMARPTMRPSPEEVAAVERAGVPEGAIAVALGGVRDWRTYTQWAGVLRGLHDAGMRAPVLLLGSDNGLAMRDQLQAAGTGLKLIDRVGQHTLGEVHEIMRHCSLVMCADGGLLHVAHTAAVPVLALFAGVIEPRFRVTAANRTTCLHGDERVDDIPVADVVMSALEAMAGPASLRRSPDTPGPNDPR